MSIFPFSALVGQELLKTALLICAVNPGAGGVLIRGDKGTAKSTAARGLAEIMPAIERVLNCPFNCDPKAPVPICSVCNDQLLEHSLELPPFVNLPLGATEDRVIGSIDFERALKEGRRAFQPGLLATAHRGILYIDEVNLLADHLVDVLLDVAAMGVNSIQREGLSISHPSRFALVGTMNLEEGDLRPQLLDRFGMMVEVEAPQDSQVRAEVIRRRISFEEDTANFRHNWQTEQEKLKTRVAKACKRLPSVVLGDELLDLVSTLCCQLGARSLRADLVICKVARTLAALDDRSEVVLEDIHTACQLALPHRTKRKATDPHTFSQEKLDQLMENAAHQQSGNGDDSNGPEANDDDQAEDDLKKNDSERIFAASNALNAARVEVETTSGLSKDGRRSTSYGQRQGRFLRATADENPTKLAVAATVQHSVLRNNGTLNVSSADLHQKVEMVKNASLVLFVVDASGSMAALKRMELVKGASVSLLEDAYKRRDQVAVIAFRKEEASLILPPTRSVQVAQKELTELPTGGRTPLAHALHLAKEISIKQRKLNGLEPLVILLSDGKANVGLTPGSDPWQDSLNAAYDLAQLHLAALVIDTESGYLRFRRAEELAKVLKAEYLSLENMSADTLSLKIRTRLRGRMKSLY